MELANTTNFILGIGTIILQATFLFLLIMMLTKDKGPIATWFYQNTLPLILLIAGGSMLASLWYSEVVGYLPCLLCWYQRIAIYPIAIIALVALIQKKGNEAFSYITALSALGVIIAIIHVFSRSTNAEIFDCSAVGPSCLQELFRQFGYIDIPVMSLTALGLILLLIWNRKRFN